jgi:hypothetical protein
MKITFNVETNKEFAYLMVNTPLREGGRKIGRIIQVKGNDKGVEVEAIIYKKFWNYVREMIKQNIWYTEPKEIGE